MELKFNMEWNVVSKSKNWKKILKKAPQKKSIAISKFTAKRNNTPTHTQHLRAHTHNHTITQSQIHNRTKTHTPKRSDRAGLGEYFDELFFCCIIRDVANKHFARGQS